MVEAKITIEHTEILLDDFAELSEEEQKEQMQTWFLENYEDPVERTPYESREGGYIYIWGGPYDAHEELSIFGGYASDELIEELAQELSYDCPEWTSVEKQSDYDDNYLDLILSDNEYYSSFNESISHVKKLLEIGVEGEAKIHLLGLLHVSVITAIETYLSDAFINTVLNNTGNMRKLVVSNPEFKKRTFKLSEVYKTFESIDNEVKKYLLSLMWHNLKKIKPLYKDTLDINYPEKQATTPIFQAIKIRHDIVHRNGKDINGNAPLITEETLNKLIGDASNFVNYINEQLEANNIEGNDYGF